VVEREARYHRNVIQGSQAPRQGCQRFFAPAVRHLANQFGLNDPSRDTRHGCNRDPDATTEAMADESLSAARSILASPPVGLRVPRSSRLSGAARSRRKPALPGGESSATISRKRLMGASPSIRIAVRLAHGADTGGV
jgi:hypothetical protein